MSDLLLDTHTLIWYRISHPSLSKRALRAIKKSQMIVSYISLWEITLLIEKGKIPFDKEISVYLDNLINDDFNFLSIETRDLKRVLELPAIHKDPFDRMLISQAINRNLCLVTKDVLIQKYPEESLC